MWWKWLLQKTGYRSRSTTCHWATPELRDDSNEPKQWTNNPQAQPTEQQVEHCYCPLHGCDVTDEHMKLEFHDSSEKNWRKKQHQISGSCKNVWNICQQQPSRLYLCLKFSWRKWTKPWVWHDKCKQRYGFTCKTGTGCQKQMPVGKNQKPK